MKKKILLVLAIFGVAITATSFNFSSNTVKAAVPGINKLVSVDSTNTVASNFGVQEGNSGAQHFGKLSQDGRSAMFISKSDDIVANDTNNATDLFVRNLQTNSTERVNVSSLGTEANAGIHEDTQYQPYAAISETGRYIVFATKATNLTSTTLPSGVTQMYLRDRQLGTTELIGVNAANDPAVNDNTYPVNISSDGRYIVYLTNSTNAGPIRYARQNGFDSWDSAMRTLLLKDRTLGTVTLVNRLNIGSQAGPWMLPHTGTSVESVATSCDGLVMAFDTTQAGITADDTTNTRDIFIADLRTGYKVTNLTAQGFNSSTSNVAMLNGMSCNGNYMTLTTNATSLVTVPNLGSPSASTLHFYAYSRTSGAYSLVDQSSGGVAASSTPNGGNSGYRYVPVSDDGVVVFHSNASNLVSGVTTVGGRAYVRNTEAGTTDLLSLNAGGQQAAGVHPHGLSLSENGRRSMYAVTGAGYTAESDTNNRVDYIMSETGQ
jgi:hypothetical protein